MIASFSFLNHARHLMSTTFSNASHATPCATSRHFLCATVSAFKYGDVIKYKVLKELQTINKN